MALKFCKNCKLKFSPSLRACPECGAMIAGSGSKGDGSGHGRRNALVLVLVLTVVSVYSAMTLETGPPPELEALHSSEGAIRQCREGIESRLSDLGATVQGVLVAAYLEGGEYEVRGRVSVVQAGSRVTRSVLCEAQFRPEGGWTIEHVEVGS